MTNFIYNFCIITYRILVVIVGLFNKKAQKLSQGERGALRKLRESVDPEGGYIWIHAASLGEFEQGRPLIEAIRRQQPQERILLTFFSPSGYEVRKNYPEVDIVSYLPFDTRYNVAEFLKIVKPRQAIFVKYEFWNNYLRGLKKEGIPTYIISAIFRESQMFFKQGCSFFRNMLHCFTHIYVQDDVSKRLLQTINIENVTVAGDTRFDRVTSIMQQARPLPLIEQFAQGHFTWIAGSSWDKDEEIFIPYFNNQPAQRLIVAPHEIHEEHLARIEARLTRPTLRLTQANEKNIQEAECLIIDSFGLLSSLYRYGQVAYIGGGFGAGIHNIIEAAVYGMPIIFGPRYQKFREARDMVADNTATPIESYTDFETLMNGYTSQPQELKQTGLRAGAYVKSLIGATDIIYNDLYTTTKN